MTKSLLIESFGAIYRLTPRQYKAFLEEGIRGNDPDLATYGRKIGVIEFNCTDASPEDYQLELDILCERKLN